MKVDDDSYLIERAIYIYSIYFDILLIQGSDFNGLKENSLI